MANREWFLTKLVGSLLGLLLLISTTVGAANMFFDLKRDVVGVTETVSKHVEKDAEFRESIGEDIDEIKSNVHSLELIDKELEMKYVEILRRFDEQREQFNELKSLQRESNAKIDNLVRAE